MEMVNNLNCPTIKEFNEEKNIDLIALFNREEKKGSGSFGLIKVLTINGKEYAVKKIALALAQNEDTFAHDLKLVKNELDTMSILSNMTENRYFPKFYGCAVKNYGYNSPIGPLDIYVFQEKMYSDVSKIKNELMALKTPLQRIELYKELAEGYAVMHKFKYVHSDIKPENIMANNSALSHLKIIDFGITDKTNKPVIGGTLLYNSPEKINGDYYNQTSHDVWALGLTIASLESKSSYIFNNVPLTCFKVIFDSNCGTIIQNKVAEILTVVYGNSSFTQLVKDMVNFHTKNRPSMQDVVNRISSIDINDDNRDIMNTIANHRKGFVIQDRNENKILELKLLKNSMFQKDFNAIKENPEANVAMYTIDHYFNQREAEGEVLQQKNLQKDLQKKLQMKIEIEAYEKKQAELQKMKDDYRNQRDNAYVYKEKIEVDHNPISNNNSDIAPQNRNDYKENMRNMFNKKHGITNDMEKKIAVIHDRVKLRDMQNNKPFRHPEDNIYTKDLDPRALNNPFAKKFLYI